MAGESKSTSNPLEQFILLSRNAKGPALTTLINQVLEAPGVFVFGELLETPNIQELANGSRAAYFELLNLFAYGTYSDYLANKGNLPELTLAQKNKLKHLTIVSLAARMKVTGILSCFREACISSSFFIYTQPLYFLGDLFKIVFQPAAGQLCIPYSVLLKDLDIKNLRELEDLIIEAIYTDIIQGKLDQRNQLLEVDFCIGRDLQKQDISNIVKTLQEWCDCCQAVLLGIEQQVLRVNQYKEGHTKTQQQVETEVANIKKTLKATASTSTQDPDQHPMDRDTPQLVEQRPSAKKLSKAKSLSSSRH